MIEQIEKIFIDRKPSIIGEYKRSAVMLLLYEEDGETYLIFEERAHNLRHQPGDICFPGGKIEKNEIPKETAIRETMEELNLKSEDMDLIGEMDYFVSPYGSIMYPFVAKTKAHNIYPSKDEVDHIIKVPIKFFLENEPLSYDMEIAPNLKEDFPYHLVKGGKNYKFSRGKLPQFFYKYEGNVIWGFTAMIVKKFAEIIKKEASE
ncbi:NUDIX hydrolase [Candidatus Clostridium radicumherbarum]|uniref:NUDIX hydrolase n=1 Tax=Candidatus Clostridium radicumherbarum TaxID=3381662 RepID=A0ABW8TPT8_9CLOT